MRQKEIPRYTLVVSSLLFSILFTACSSSVSVQQDDLFAEAEETVSDAELAELRANFDTDSDGLHDAEDPCPATASNDADGDGICEVILSDINGDGCVDLADQSILANTYGQSGEGLAADLVPDGQINISDVAVMASEKGLCQDNCPNLANADQADSNFDGVGDLCEDVSATCGNEVIEGTEVCDGSDLDGKTCGSLGFASGTLTCTEGCVFDMSNCRAALGQPTISEGPTTISEDALVTIRGENFGTKIPAAPLVWDNFENGTVGEVLRNQPAIIGDWDDGQGAWNVTYTDAMGYGGSSQSAAHGFGEAAVDVPRYNASLAKNKYDGGFPVLYIDWKGYIPSYPNGLAGWKPWRVYGPESASTGEAKIWRTGYGCTASTLKANGHPDYQEWGARWEDYGDVVDQWFHWQVGMQESSAPGVADGFFHHYLNAKPYKWTDGTFANGYRTDTKNRGYVDNLDEIRIGHYMSTNERGGCLLPSSFTVYTDDIYIDTTWARVEIGNAPTYDECTRREIQIPTAWSNGELTFKVNQGAFSSGDNVYVFVFNRDNEISNSFPMRIN